MLKRIISRHGANTTFVRNLSSAIKQSFDGNNIVVPKIGLEIHAQLDLKSKLFSHGGNLYQAASNTQLDLLDVAMPGTLPKLNSRALDLAILSSLGLKCSIQRYMHFDRKNYFYADMPAGYQLTQFNCPIARDGHIDFVVDSYQKNMISSPYKNPFVVSLHLEEKRSHMQFEKYIKRSYIRQIQLEQDSAKTLTHIDDEEQRLICDLVDYNRCGACLIEVVFEPDLKSHHEATSLVMELVSTLRALRTCRCELQEGTLRVDANVSIASLDGREIVSSSKVELKNLNSLKALSKGIQSEVERQIDILESGGIVASETRTYDTKSGMTLPLRIKEETVDYRFVPDPNLPPIRLEEDYIKTLERGLTSGAAAENPLEKPVKSIQDRAEFEIKNLDEIEVLCVDLIKGMKNVSRKYARDGQSRHMYMMLDKLCETTNDKVDVFAARKILHKLLRKPLNQAE